MEVGIGGPARPPAEPPSTDSTCPWHPPIPQSPPAKGAGAAPVSSPPLNLLVLEHCSRNDQLWGHLHTAGARVDLEPSLDAPEAARLAPELTGDIMLEITHCSRINPHLCCKHTTTTLEQSGLGLGPRGLPPAHPVNLALKPCSSTSRAHIYSRSRAH